MACKNVSLQRQSVSSNVHFLTICVCICFMIKAAKFCFVVLIKTYCEDKSSDAECMLAVFKM